MPISNKPRFTRLGSALAFIIAAMALQTTSCADPLLVMLDFKAPGAPVLTTGSASVSYSWSFTVTSDVAGSEGLPVRARLYKQTAVNLEEHTETRILVAEKQETLKTASGSASMQFLADLSGGGAFYVEFAYADDLGPQVETSGVATL